MPKPCEHDSHAVYEWLIGPLREKARELGYALAAHGTLVRDIDLIAVPWTRTAVDARTLAQALNDVAAAYNGGTAFRKPDEDDAYFWAGSPGLKPHGRLVWSIHLGGGPYIDLSVMPRADPPHMTGEQAVQLREEAELRGPMKGYVRGHEVR
jgi:hypothetical protein